MQPFIPETWDMRDPNTWMLRTTAHAHLGYHKTGLPVREYRDVTIAVTDFEPASEIERTPESMAWWYAVVSTIHRCQVALLEASPEQIGRVAQRLGVDADPDALWEAFPDAADDLERWADAARTLERLLGEEERHVSA